MLLFFSRVSTWLFIELTATSILLVLNLTIPMLMMFTSYRNIVNFYFSSVGLSSSLINCLYMYYLAQTLRSKALSENNCRAIYYLQASCIFVLAYTVAAMHANFVLCLFPTSSDQSQSTRTCLRSCGFCLRRFFRRFCFCLVLGIWSLSFTSTIPLLYTIDSNEKTPKPVHCPGTTQVSYLDEWFDRNRLIQTMTFNLIPFLISVFLSMVALLKLLYDSLAYVYLRVSMSRCSPCRGKFLSSQRASIPNSMSMLSSLGMIGRASNPLSIPLSPMFDASTPTSETSRSSADFPLQSWSTWLSSSFLRFLLVFSCCLLACIYPIAMRFYLIYFSVLVPLIFTVMNYSLAQSNVSPPQLLLNNNQQDMIIENRPVTITTISAPLTTIELPNTNIGQFLHDNDTIVKRERNGPTHEQFEMRSPLIANLMHEREESTESSRSSATTLPSQQTAGKRKYFANHLYENSRTLFLR